MPFIEYDERLYPLGPGPNLLSSTAEANVRISELPASCRIRIDVERSGAFALAMGANGSIAINGHPIDGKRVPLFDGDELTITSPVGSPTLIFIDDTARDIVRGHGPPPIRAWLDAPPPPFHSATSAPTPRSSPGREEGNRLIGWILLLALAELLAILLLG